MTLTSEKMLKLMEDYAKEIKIDTREWDSCHIQEFCRRWEYIKKYGE